MSINKKIRHAIGSSDLFLNRLSRRWFILLFILVFVLIASPTVYTVLDRYIVLKQHKKASSDLAWIGRVILLYTRSNNDSMPQSLSELSIFSSSEYIQHLEKIVNYYGSGLNSSAIPAEQVVASEKLIRGMDMVSVLLADGTVTSIPSDIETSPSSPTFVYFEAGRTITSKSATRPSDGR